MQLSPSVRARRATIAFLCCLSAIVLSQIWLAQSAGDAAIREYRRLGGGSAAGCGRPTVSSVMWWNLNQFVVAVEEDCSSPKQGEGMKLRLKWGLAGWHVLEVYDHVVV